MSAILNLPRAPVSTRASQASTPSVAPMSHQNSQALFTRARALLPGGVNSPVRAYGSVGGDPICLARGKGAYVWDVDDNRYLDFVGSWGPLILGHAHPGVLEAIAKAAQNGTTFGATTKAEVLLAEQVCALMPSVACVRFVSSGTEATMSAARLARGFTQRNRIIKFAGCYHGHADVFLVDEAGSGLVTLGQPGSAGVPPGATQDTMTVPFNDLERLKELMYLYGHEVAAIIVEPLACNMGMVPAAPGFLAGLRKACDDAGSLLIFDEVVTGFRVGLSGAQARYQVTPDLTTFGKVIGGGLPVGAYGGRADVMAHVAPCGPVYQAGTLSGNPLAMAAGLATLKEVSRPGFYQTLQARADLMGRMLNAVLQKHNSPARLMQEGSIFYLWFNSHADADPKNLVDIKMGDSKRYGRFFHALLQHGVTLAPSAFEVGFISQAHSDDDIERAVNAMDAAWAQATQED